MKPILVLLLICFAQPVLAQSDSSKRHNSFFLTAAAGKNYTKRVFGNTPVSITAGPSNACLFQAEYNFKKYEKGVYFSAGLYWAIYDRSYTIKDSAAGTVTDKEYGLHYYGTPLSANIPIKLGDDCYIINQLSAMPALARDLSPNFNDYYIDVTVQYALLVNYKMAVLGLRIHRPFTNYKVYHSANDVFRYTAVMFTAGIRLGKS